MYPRGHIKNNFAVSLLNAHALAVAVAVCLPSPSSPFNPLYSLGEGFPEFVVRGVPAKLLVYASVVQLIAVGWDLEAWP